MKNAKNPKETNFYGQELILNLYDCDLSIISSRDAIHTFIIELCGKIIHMKRFGEPIIKHFGHENPISSGYSLVQLIETSCVTAHYSEFKRSVYINIFSCARFDPKKTEAYCKEFYKAKRVEAILLERP